MKINALCKGSMYAIRIWHLHFFYKSSMRKKLCNTKTGQNEARCKGHHAALCSFLAGAPIKGQW